MRLYVVISREEECNRLGIYTIKGKFGYWIEDGINEYVSYEKYKK